MLYCKRGYAILCDTSSRTFASVFLCVRSISRHIIWQKSAMNRFTPTFGDGRKRNTLGSAWTPREEGRALAARDRLPRIHDTARTVRPSRLPRHRHGPPGGMLPPHLWRCAGLRGHGGPPGRGRPAATPRVGARGGADE